MEVTLTITGSPQRFRVALAGVTFPNADGTNRQVILKSLRAGDQLHLKREPENPHDRYAVAVRRADGQQLGYMPAGDTRLANHIDSGGTASARVVQVTGGPGLLGLFFKAFRRSYGCVIEVVKGDPDWKKVTPYMDRSREIDDLISKTHALEETDPARAIDGYRKAIQEIVDLDRAGLVAASWRRARYPINRLSLLLEKQRDYQGALQAILAYEAYSDICGITSADNKSVAARKERLTRRIQSGKSET